MKPILKLFGVITVLSLLVAIVVAQIPAAPTPEPDGWHWTRVYGQRVQVWGRLRGGELTWGPDWRDPEKLSPAEWARRQNQQPAQAAPRRPDYQTNGVVVDKLDADAPVLRASDPQTYQQAVHEAAKARPQTCEVHGAEKCPNGGGCKRPVEPERKPGVLERAESDLERGAKLAVCFVVLLLGVFVLVKSLNYQSPR